MFEVVILSVVVVRLYFFTFFVGMVRSSAVLSNIPTGQRAWHQRRGAKRLRMTNAAEKITTPIGALVNIKAVNGS